MKLESRSAAYSRVHVRLYRQRGSAKHHRCIDCSKQANHWSWKHDTDPFDLQNYYPKCRSCHFKYDMTPEWIENAALGRTGLKRSIESRAKMSASKKAFLDSQGQEYKDACAARMRDAKQ